MIRKRIGPSMRGASLVLGVAASSFVPLGTQAQAQVTAAQREACTPDALRFCSDAIPDVGRVKSCMIAHRADLSARCQSAFGAARPTPGGLRVAARHGGHVGVHAIAARSHRGGVTRVASADRHRGSGGFGGSGSMANVAMGMRMAQRFIGIACASDYLSADACGMSRQFLSYAP